MSKAILVLGAADAHAALAAAQALGCPVTLISAPAAAAHGGAAWFQALVATASASHPGVAVTAILDCADLPGLVLGALRTGVPHLRFTGPPEVAARLKALARAAGATLHDPGSFTGPCLHLRGVADPVTACREWLAAPPLPIPD